jgi:hypothetical protein
MLIMFDRLTSNVSGMLVCLVVVGCGSSSTNDYVPDDNAGKRAIETALSAWQNGQLMKRIESDGAAAVEPQDSEWKRGKTLASFSIGDEVPTTEGPKQFAVRLTFQGVAQPVDAVYFVVGRDPLWVFRDRDYQRATGM